MKYLTTALIIAGLAFLPTGLLAQTAPPNPPSAPAESGPGSALKRDVLILLRAKLSDPVIIGYIRKNLLPGEVFSSQDVIDLRQAGASDAVLKALLDAPSAASGQAAPSSSSGGTSTYLSPDTSTTYYYSSPYASNYYGGYGPYYGYPYYYYGYPYWGGPYWGFGVSIPFFFHSHDGHFHDGHIHDGHFHGGVPHGGFVSHGGMGHGGGHH